MTAVKTENPILTRARNMQEWEAEVSQIVQFPEQEILTENQKKFRASLKRAEKRRAKVWAVLAQEEAEQVPNAEKIRQENIEHAKQLASVACASCFCIHPGDC